MNLFYIGSLADIFGENGALPTILGGIMNGIGTVADFFTTNTLGQIILCVGLVSIIWAIIMRIVNKIVG